MNMSGAQYAARFAFPSNIVLINGRPNAKVFWEAQNAAATVSPALKFRNGSENALNRTPKDSK